jgi:hypothetical protein
MKKQGARGPAAPRDARERGNLVAVLACSCQRTWSVYDGDGWMVRQLVDWSEHTALGMARARCTGERSATQVTTVALF